MVYFLNEHMLLFVFLNNAAVYVKEYVRDYIAGSTLALQYLNSEIMIRAKKIFIILEKKLPVIFTIYVVIHLKECFVLFLLWSICSKRHELPLKLSMYLIEAGFMI